MTTPRTPPAAKTAEERAGQAVAVWVGDWEQAQALSEWCMKTLLQEVALAIRQAQDEARAEEREACAQVADEDEVNLMTMARQCSDDVDTHNKWALLAQEAGVIASLIRTRSSTPAGPDEAGEGE